MTWACRRVTGRLILAALAATGPACASHEHSIDVIALNGDVPQGAALVVAHRPDGSIIDSMQVDADGRAKPTVEDDSLVTVIFPRDAVATRIYTVAVAGMTGALTVHAPPAQPSYATVGRLDATASAYMNADDYEVRLACGGTHTATWPVSVDFDATCIGTDSQVPVVINARAAGQPLAYAAGVVAISNGIATFSASSWLPVTPNIPIQSTDPTVQISVTLWIDGLPFLVPVSGAGALRWEGLPVDHTTIQAGRGNNSAFQDTTRDQYGVPIAISFEDGDFLPAVDPTLMFTGLPTKGGSGQPLHASWQSSQVTADVLNLFFGYLSNVDQKDVLWSIVLAPESTDFTTPRFEGAFEAFAPRDDPSNLLQRIDSPDLVGFDAARAAGIYSLPWTEVGTIVQPVSSGELRQSSIAWYGP